MPGRCKKSYLEEHDVFIAYASSDAALATCLCEVVEGQGLSAFIDRRAPTGERFRDYLPQQLNRAKVVVMLWTAEFARRDFTMSEVDLALKQGTYFGVMIETLETEQLYGVDQYNWFDLKGWKGDPNDGRLDELLADIRHFIDRRGATDAARMATTKVPGLSENDQVSGSEVTAYREELLSCTVDRALQTSSINDLITSNSRGRYGVFLIEAYEKHWLRALAVHVALRQGRDSYPLLEDGRASLTSAMQESLIETGDIGRGSEAFARLLASTLRLSGQPEGLVAGELADRVSRGRGVTVVYVPLIDSRDRRYLADIIEGSLAFLEQLPAFASGHRLVVLFGCNCAGEHAFNPLSWWRNRRIKRLHGRGLIQLKSPGKIQPTHIETWFNKFPPNDKARYRFPQIDQAIAGRFSELACYYDSLKYPLLEALESARIRQRLE